MSNISANSSFERISDYDHLDETTRRIQTDAVQAYARLSEERMKLLEQRLTNAVSRGFWLGLLSACFLCFLVIGACSIFSGISSVRHNASQTVKKFNVTMVNPENVYNFPKEEKLKFLDDVERGKEEFSKFMKMHEIRESFQETTDICQVPEYLRNKFVPNFSTFDGVHEFLQKTQTNGTIVDDYLYYTTPRFECDTGISTLQFVKMDTLEIVEGFRIEDCEELSDDCHSFDWFMKNGDLYIRETFVLNSQEYEFTRAYFIPPNEMTILIMP